MHWGSTIVAGLALGTMFAGQVSAQRAPEWMNPLLQPSAPPYGVPRFDQIRNEDFRAALDQGMREELADIDRIAGNDALPTFVNTMEALERSGAPLRRTQRVFNSIPAPAAPFVVPPRSVDRCQMNRTSKRLA